MPLHPHRSPSATLALLAPALGRWTERLLAGHQPRLSLVQFLALEALEDGPRPAAELAREAGVSPAAISQLVATLEGDGLVERAEPGPDRRVRPLALTRGGAKVLDSARVAVQSGLEQALGDLSRPHADRLARALEPAVEALRGRRPPPRPPPPRHPPAHGPKRGQ